MFQFISWYLVFAFIGIIFFPIIYKALPFLADRGYIFSRIAGLLFWGYIYWILNIFGIIHNNLNGILFCLILILIIAYLFIHGKDWTCIIRWIKENKKIVLVVEILFFLSFLLWTIVRRANPDITGTEKPMELAFINSILRSTFFPPADPWLSGYSISYYYFGYVIVAMLARLTNVTSSVAFNLALSAWFALTAIGCYGVVYNLLSIWQTKHRHNYENNEQSKPIILLSSLLGPLFVLIVSNAEGFLEMLHSKGLFWKMGLKGVLESWFWTWVNILELNQPPSTPFTLIPERLGGIWWWRASRVIQDMDVTGNAKEVIDEFPFFTHLLGDLHPHLLSMPFVLLALGVGINLYLGGNDNDYLTSSIRKWLKAPFFWFVVLVCGGIAFLNTWDLPVFLGFILIIFITNRIARFGWHKNRLIEFIISGLFVGFFSFIAYLPFFLGFSSQAGGILPSINFFTRGINFWVMFLPLIAIISMFLIWLMTKVKWKGWFVLGMKYSSLFILLLFISSYALGLFIGNADAIMLWIQGIIDLKETNTFTSASTLVSMFKTVHGGLDFNKTLLISIQNRIISPFTSISLLLILSLALAYILLIFEKRKMMNYLSRSNLTLSKAYFPIVLLIILGSILCILPEFFYLKDLFGTRMNTIFKFYFQAWIIWGLAASTGLIIVWHEIKSRWGYIIKVLSMVLILLSLAYPFWGLVSKTNGFKPVEWTLDGNAYLRRYNNDEYKAIEWFDHADYGILVEAVGGSYSGFARISSLTGLPTVLGWPGHELQWRGGVNEMGTREGDVLLLYSTYDWLTAKEIIEKYDIRYIYLGDLERSKYQSNEKKFADNLQLVFSNSSVKIYEYMRD